MAKKYYAVRKGNQTGIFESWADCQKAIAGFHGTQFKGFNDLNEAKSYLNGKNTYEIAEDLDYSDYEIVIHTDGGCRNHGNKKGGHVLATDPAAWAMIMRDHDHHKTYTATDGKKGKTNNYMEITAVAKALYHADKLQMNHKKILIVCDSKYALHASDQKFIQKSSKQKFEMPNGEIWQYIAAMLPKFDNITWAWTHGHNGEEDNDFVDALLNVTMDNLEDQPDRESPPFPSKLKGKNDDKNV